MSVRLLLPVLPAFLLVCSAPREISPFYFILFPALRLGGERPTPPANLSAEYQPYTEQLLLRWDGSMDPDLNIPVGLYRVYLYLKGPPETFYREQDLLAETVFAFYNFRLRPFSGSFYFVVTAFDGGVESFPSEVLQFQFAQ